MIRFAPERDSTHAQACKDRRRQRCERWLAEALRQSFFRDGAIDAPMAVFKRMDAFKMQVSTIWRN